MRYKTIFVMANIPDCSGSVFLNSAIICCTNDPLSMSFEVKLFTFESLPGWPLSSRCLYFEVSWPIRTSTESYCRFCLFSCSQLHRKAVMKDMAGVVNFEGNFLPVVVLCVFWDYLFRISSLACLQPRYLERRAVSPSASWQLQHVRVEVGFSFSG
jgi:hypothetical protein